MKWQDEGIVLKVVKLGEYDGIVTIFTKNHGKRSGMVKAAYSKKIRPLVQLGNALHVIYRSRLDEQLGFYRIELISNYAVNVLTHSGKLNALKSATAIIDASIHFDQTLEFAYGLFRSLLISLSSESWASAYCRWEISLLGELGVGIDLSKCVVSGRVDNLMFVSPKSGSAVCGEKGEPYANKLLALPSFLINETSADAVKITGQDISNSLRLSGFFIAKAHAQQSSKPLPCSRESLVDWFLKRADKNYY